MPLPTLTPLQSRFAATLTATLLLLVLYLVLFSPRLAYATELVRKNSPYNPFIHGCDTEANEVPCMSKFDHLDGVDEGYETQDPNIIRRAPAGLISLGNNQFQKSNIKIGETQWWVFPKEAVNGPHSLQASGLPAYVPVAGNSSDSQPISDELRRRAFSSGFSKRSTTVYVSLNTCQKPDDNTTDSRQGGSFPQLEVYISLSDTLQKPGPAINSSVQTLYRVENGYMGTTVEADNDVFIAVAAPNTTAYAGIYNYDIAASIDGYFHSIDETNPFLFFIDSDMSSALLVTDNVTQAPQNSTNYQEWMNLTAPFTIFANNINNLAIRGLEKSYCALSQLAQIGPGNNAIEAGMTNRGLGNKPKEQFYITGLERSSIYYGILAMEGNSTNSGNGVVGGGGKVWRPMNFSTKADNNCALLYNLSFCSEVAYAVPTNASLNASALAQIYDTNAQSLYQNFSYSLQQIQCKTSATSQYSFAVSCDDCDFAYKQWLCAVTIPRCYDFSSNLPFLQPRNAGQAFLNGTELHADDPLRISPVSNASRNPLIDSVIHPGPYKEVLPCQDLCSELARTCPAALGFGCPNREWFNKSYGVRNPNGDITCSYLGAVYYLSTSWNIHDGISSLLYALFGFWAFILTWMV